MKNNNLEVQAVSSDKKTLTGYVDIIDSKAAIGWAIDQASPNTPVKVELYVNGQLTDTAICDLVRPDVMQAGHATSKCGFRFELEDVSAFVRDPEISVKFYASGEHLPNSPQKITGLSDNIALTPTTTLMTQVNPANGAYFFGFPSAKKLHRTDIIERAHAHKLNGGEILVFPPLVDWNIPLFQRPQHMANWFAKIGVMVIYASSAWKFDTADGCYQLDDNLYWTNQLSLLLDDLPPSWISIYSTNFNYSAADLASWRATGHKIVYEYIDHIDPKISGAAASTLSTLYSALNQNNIDLFVASADVLYEELQGRFGKEKLALVPNGVDMEFYSANRHRTENGIQQNFLPIVDLSKAGNKIVGYFGAIAPWLDYKLIQGIADKNPDIHFVYIGPPYDLRGNLPVANNIHWIGKIDYHNLPKHAAWFDVCLIPFEEGDIAKTTSPLKLFEYFALQKPVVVTSWMHECVQYREVFHGTDVKSVSASLHAALSVADNPRAKTKLEQLAIQNSWEARSITMLAAMREQSEDTKHETLIRFNKDTYTSVAFNSDMPERICGVRSMFNHKINALIIGFAQEDFYPGDILSTTLNYTHRGEENVLLCLDIRGTKLDSQPGTVKIDIIINGMLVKILDYKDLENSELVRAVMTKDAVIELRMRVAQQVQASWHPSTSYTLTVTRFTKTEQGQFALNSLHFSNPKGRINPMLKNLAN